MTAGIPVLNNTPEIRPASDEEIAAFTGDIAIYRREHDGKLHCTRCYAESAGHRPGCDHALWPSIKARIEADRAQIKRCHAIMQGLVSLAEVTDDADIQVYKDAEKELSGEFCPGSIHGRAWIHVK